MQWEWISCQSMGLRFLDSQVRETRWPSSHWDLPLQRFTQLRHRLEHVRKASEYHTELADIIAEIIFLRYSPVVIESPK